MAIPRVRNSSVGSSCERGARDAPECLQIAIAHRARNVVGNLRAWCLAIPLALVTQSLQVVAQRLFVEARRSCSHAITVACPEAGTVWRHHLVYQYNVTASPTEFELGNSEDQPRLGGDSGAVFKEP